LIFRGIPTRRKICIIASPIVDRALGALLFISVEKRENLNLYSTWKWTDPSLGKINFGDGVRESNKTSSPVNELVAMLQKLFFFAMDVRKNN
jgi:hypothetical protein